MDVLRDTSCKRARGAARRHTRRRRPCRVHVRESIACENSWKSEGSGDVATMREPSNGLNLVECNGLSVTGWRGVRTTCASSRAYSCAHLEAEGCDRYRPLQRCKGRTWKPRVPESSVSYFSSSAFTCSGVMPTQSWGSGGREQVSTVSGSVAVSTEHVTAAGATAAGSEESPRSRRQGPCSSGGTSAARGRAASQGRGEAHLVAEGIEFVHVELTVAVGVVLAEDLCEHLALVAAPLEERV